MPAPIAPTVASVIDPTGSSIGITAYDGSKAGPPDAKVTVHIRSVDALRHAVTAPGSLGLARAFVSGSLDLDGDPYEFLQMVSEAKLGAVSWRERLSVLRELGPTVLRPLAPPPEEAPSRWRLGLRHAQRRDAVAISHHYDVSNRFYEMVLGPTMAYTCAVYPTLDSTLEEAQIEKVDLVCRKLGLKPGMRLLDVGCGWGTMVRHAAKEYGVKALGVTLSKAQADWAAEAIEREGLSDKAEVRFSDYREVRESGFDAISSIGLTEHIGKAKFAAYVRHLQILLKPQGRLLNHCITRPSGHESAIHKRGFISRYAFPDGELLSPGFIVSGLHDNGFEVRHEENFREHYAMTLRDWCANLDRNWDACVAEAGLGRAKVWALYMAGSRLGFDENRIQLHQVLAVKTTNGRSGVPLRQDW
jgi:cyclopropane-fatty-acyl-phospholipid synthase